MESKIKGGGGALTRNDLQVKHDASVNLEKTQKAQSDGKYLKVFNWAIANGVIMPSLQFPVAFWDEGIIGLSAKVDIPSNKAFLFIPRDLVISASVAKKSDIGVIFAAHPFFFSGHQMAEFDTLLIFLIYERAKGSQSKWAPYFDAISDIEILADWSESELLQLQDALLVYNAYEQLQKIEQKWTSFQEIFDEHCDIFPQGSSLKQYFDWSYRVILTRGFYLDELQLIPIADFMNYANHELVFESKDHEILSLRAQHPEEVDYRDFLGNPIKGQGVIENERYKNRLEKFLAKGQGKENLKNISSIWEIEKVVREYESSDNEEELEILQYKAEEEEEEEEELMDEERKIEMGEDYVVVNTDPYGGFKQGAPILYQIKRLCDRDWLMQYGFCFENNWFNSFYLLFWSPSYGKTGLITLEEIQTKAYQAELSAANLSDVCELIIMKEKKINLEIFKYFRKTLNYAKLNLPEPNLKASPLNIDVELAIIEMILELFNSLEEKMSPLSHDANLLNRNLPKRMKYALVYRISQKRIINQQKKMLSILKSILNKYRESGSLEKHLTEKTIKGVKQTYPLLPYLKSFLVNLKNSKPRKP